MRRSSLFLGLMIATTTGCFGDPITTSPARQPVTTNPAPTQFSWIAGTVVVDDEQSDGVVRLMLGGESITIAGSAELLRRVNGADVTVYGTWVSADIFDALDFQVLGVGGEVAYDGVLVDGGYALEMRDGTVRTLDDPSAELMAHVGARVWITLLPESNTPANYGIISERVS